MSNYSNYPPGAATDPSAPWNQVDPEELEFAADVTVTLAKTATVMSDDYDSWGEHCHDLYEAYERSEYSVVQMIEMLKEYVQRDLDNKDYSMHKKSELKDILTSAEGWEEIETDIEEA